MVSSARRRRRRASRRRLRIAYDLYLRNYVFSLHRQTCKYTILHTNCIYDVNPYTVADIFSYMVRFVLTSKTKHNIVIISVNSRFYCFRLTYRVP